VPPAPAVLIGAAELHSAAYNMRGASIAAKFVTPWVALDIRVDVGREHTAEHATDVTPSKMKARKLRLG
jgi:hypothetical protein